MAATAANTERHTWLTSEFLETILKSSENQKNAKVIDFVVHDAVGKGENFTSYLMRVTVTYTADGLNTKHKSFIIKTILESAEMNAVFKNVGLFDKEIAYYRDIQPKFEKYLDMIDKNFKCAPSVFAVQDAPTYLVFEDLKTQNYRNIDKGIGLDFNATAMILRKLAKFHAITAMIYEESPKLFEPHKMRILSHKHMELLPAFTSGLRDCQQMCLKWPGYEHFYDKFQPWLDNVVDISALMYDKDDSTFNTLTHGDLWVNNIMFRFDEKNNPDDVIFVDYQMGYYGPPALDITYLFYTSTSNGLLEQDWDRLLQIYHTELIKSLELVSYPKRIPSLTELQIQMFKKSLCSAIISFTLVPPRHMDSKNELEVEHLMSDSEDVLKNRYAVYDKPVVYERLQYLLDFYDRKGFFGALP